MKGPIVGRQVQGNGKSCCTGLMALGIFLISFLLYLPIDIPSKYYNGGDNLWTVPTAISIVKNGNIDLSEFGKALRMMPTSDVWVNDIENDPRLIKIGHNYYNYFPIGSALVSIPFVLADYRGIKDAANSIAESLWISRVAAKVLAALSVSLLFILLRQLQQSVLISSIITGVFAFATPHFSIHSDALWSHNVMLPFLISALCLLVADSGRYSWLSALPLAFSFIIRPDASLAIATLALYMLFYQRRYFIRFLVLGGIVGIAFMLWSYSTYGTFLPQYYKASRLSPSVFPSAAVAHLLSPNRGLLIFSPVLIISLLGVVISFVRWTKVKPIFRFLSVLLVMHWLMISMFPSWWGGFSYGTRLFCSMLPVWMVLFVPAVETLQTVSKCRRLIAVSLLTVAFLWSLFVQIVGVSNVRVYEWSWNPTNIDIDQSKVWNWQDMQILRILKPQIEASLPAKGFRAQITINGQPSSLKVSSTSLIKATVKNISEVAWPALGQSSVRLSYHWLSREGKIISEEYEGFRTTLPNDLIPNKEIDLDIKIKTPNKTGNYILEYDMVQEKVSWFKDKGSKTVRFNVKVE